MSGLALPFKVVGALGWFVAQYGLWLWLFGVCVALLIGIDAYLQRRRRQRAARQARYAPFVAPAVGGIPVRPARHRPGRPSGRDTAPLPTLPPEGQAARR